MPNTMNQEVISAAIEGFEAQKRRIDEKIGALRAALSGEAPSEAGPTPGAGQARRKMSAGARRRIAAAQRKRWAAAKKESAAQASPVRTRKGKRRLSAAGRERIIEANRKRWAAAKRATRRAQRGTKNSPSKKAAAQRKAAGKAPATPATASNAAKAGE